MCSHCNSRQLGYAVQLTGPVVFHLQLMKQLLLLACLRMKSFDRGHLLLPVQLSSKILEEGMW